MRRRPSSINQIGRRWVSPAEAAPKPSLSVAIFAMDPRKTMLFRRRNNCSADTTEWGKTHATKAQVTQRARGNLIMGKTLWSRGSAFAADRQNRHSAHQCSPQWSNTLPNRPYGGHGLLYPIPILHASPPKDGVKLTCRLSQRIGGRRYIT